MVLKSSNNEQSNEIHAERGEIYYNCQIMKMWQDIWPCFKVLNHFPCTHRKSCFGDPKVQKSRGKSAKLSPQKAELQPGSPNQRELRSKETPEKTVPLRSGAERDIMLPCKEEPELSCQIEDLPFMSTTEMYLCCWNQPPLSPLRETSPKKEEEVASEWTPHVVHDMLIVCKPNLYPIFNHYIHQMY